MKKQLEIVLKILLYSTFFVPLIVIPSSFIFPFIVPKILTFRALTEVMMGVYALLLIINWREYRPRFTALNLAVGAFLASFALSTFIGVDPYHSFWDNHERMLGLFTILHFGAYYFIATAILRTWSDWKWALRVFLLAGAGVMVVGVMQRWVDSQLLLNQGSDRVASTLGNSIYVGGYGLFLSFVSYLLFVREKNSVWRWVYSVLGVLSLLGMFYSGTRGSMLGFVAGVGVGILGYIITLKNNKKIRYSLIGVAVLGVIAISMLYAFRKTDFVFNLPAVGRAVNTSLADIQASPRWIAWQIAIESWKDRPFFGWGPNNYFYAFNAHYNPKSLNFGYGETWFDNAHNIIVNTLAVQGAFGIITYLAIFIIGAAVLFAAWKKYGLNLHVAVVGSAFLAAHLVGNVTVFENPTSYLYFMFWLALANSMSMINATVKNEPVDVKNPKPATATSLDRRIGAGSYISVSLVVSLLVFVFNIQPARANNQTLDAIRYLTQDPVLGITYVRAALSFNSPHIDDIRADIGRTTAQLLSGSGQKLGKDRSQEIFDLVYPELQKNLILHPLDIRNQITLAQLAQIGFTINNKPNYFYEAQSYLQDALVKSPRRQQVIYSLSAIQMQIGKSDEAAKLLESAIEGNPAIAESYWRLMYAYKLSDREDKAYEIKNLALKNGVVFSDQEQGIVNMIVSPTYTPKIAPKLKK